MEQSLQSRKSEESLRTADASRLPFRMKIRLATRADAAELRAIYAYYVENTTVSFEYEAPSVAEMERRVAEVEGVYPFLVCVAECKNEQNEQNGQNGQDAGFGKSGERIVGYALAHRAFERAAYSWVAETAVYVDRNWRRLGIGEALYSALIEILTAQGLRSLYAVVVAENKPSVEFHRRFGYRDFATFKNSGWKFERWLDVVWLERTLGVWRDASGRNEEAEAGNSEERDRTEGAPRTEPAAAPLRTIAEFSTERLTEIFDEAARRFASESASK